MNAIILEDEIVATKRLKRLLEKIDPSVHIVKNFETIKELAEYLLANDQPDLLFLDIHVTDGNSFELFDLVPISSKVIFVTAYDQYAVQAFRKNAIDYLLKPIKIDELINAITKARRYSSDQITPTKNELLDIKTRFLIKIGAKFKIVKTTDIAYIYTENKITYFVQKNGIKVPSEYKLNEIIHQLNKDLFFRINRQFIINIQAIKDIIAYSKSRVKITLNPTYNGEVVVSSETTPKFKEWLNR